MDWPTDIVAQLRTVSVEVGETIHDRHPKWMCHKAADEIEKLRAAIRDAAKLIDNDLVGPWAAAHGLDDVIR